MTDQEEDRVLPVPCRDKEKQCPPDLTVQVSSSSDNPDITSQISGASALPDDVRRQHQLSPMAACLYAGKRDSGYLTDSPASQSTTQFTYDLASTPEDLSGELFRLSISTSEICEEDEDEDDDDDAVFTNDPMPDRWFGRIPTTQPIAIPQRRSGLNAPGPPIHTSSPQPRPLRHIRYSTGSLPVGISVNHGDGPGRLHVSTQTPRCYLNEYLYMPWYIGEEPPRALRPDQALVERRPRHHSDDFDMERVAPLPDLIQFRRDRSRSEPSVTPIFSPEEAGEWGRQLRRISDEFHFSYSFEGRLGSIAENTPPDDNQSSSYPGARRNWIQTLYQRIVRPTRRHSQSDLEPGPVLRKNHFWREQ